MENNNNFDTFYEIREDEETVDRIKSNILGLWFMSDDNFVISYLDKTNEEQYYYIDNYKAYIVVYIPELDLSIKWVHLEWATYHKWNVFDVNTDLEKVTNIL